MNINQLSFDPTKFVSKAEAMSLIYGFTNEDLPLIEIGSQEVTEETRVIITFMDEWVKRLDKTLNKLTQDSPLYVRLFKERGCTFSEYKDLFNSGIEENLYYQFPAFEFFAKSTIDKFTLWNFLQGKQPNEEHYIKDLLKANLSTLIFFFDKLQAVIPYKNLKRHAYISGKSGSGKSELMKLIFYGIQKRSQSKKSASLVVIDPHGDLVEELKNLHLNKKHQDRLIYINPYLKEGYTPVINPLQLASNDERSIDIMSQQLEKVFKELVSDTTVTRPMQTLLIPCLSTLMRKGDATLEDLQRFMNDKYNEDLVELGKQSPIKTHRKFFERDFRDPLFKKSKVSIRTKLQSLLNYQTFTNLLCGKPTIDLEKELNSGKVILFNLSKGKLGDETSKAFGTFIVGCINGIAKKREDMEKKDRKPTFVFIDECHNYVIESTKEILAENRKYALHLVLANQYLHQVQDDYQRAFKSNTDVKVAGRNDDEHFRSIAAGMTVKKEQLLKLKEYQFYIRTGDRTPLKFKSPSLLVCKPSNPHYHFYYLSKEERQELDDYLINDSGYYAPIAPDEFKKNIETEDDEKVDTTSSTDNDEFRFNKL